MDTSGDESGGYALDTPAQKLTIFINYRREDTDGQAQLLTDRLEREFGQGSVYLDVAQRSGTDWRREIQAKGSEAGALLVLIGRQWSGILQARSAAASVVPVDDFVRNEIEWALRDWPGIVIPVLVGVQMPAPEILPRSIRGLCRRQASLLRHDSLQDDLDALVKRLRQLPDEVSDTSDNDVARPSAIPRKPAVDGVAEPNHGHYVDVLNAMLEGCVVPVLGPSVRGSLPDADYLAVRLAQQFGLRNGPPAGAPETPDRNESARDSGERPPDLAEVAQRIAVSRGEKQLHAAIKSILRDESKSMPVHHFLAEFPRLLRRRGLDPPPPQLIISTNYDRALEEAFEEVNEPFDHVVYVARDGRFIHLPWGESASAPESHRIDEPEKYARFPTDEDGELLRTVIVKMHGAPDGGEGAERWRDNYVVTEDDYIDYLPSQSIASHLPVQLLDKLTGSQCLFLGYPLGDWNARVLLRRIWQGARLTENSWAITPEPDPLESDLWGAIPRVKLLTVDMTDYVDGLRFVLLDWLEEQRSPRVMSS